MTKPTIDLNILKLTNDIRFSTKIKDINVRGFRTLEQAIERRLIEDIKNDKLNKSQLLFALCFLERYCLSYKLINSVIDPQGNPIKLNKN